MSQSAKLIVLQFLSLFLGFFSTFYVAGRIPSRVFAIVGVYEIITSIAIVFSTSGMETLAIRNVLMWQKDNRLDKIFEIITQSIVVRVLFSSILILPIFLYAFYLSKYKFNNDYFLLFTIMSISSLFSALNNSLVLLFKAFNRYFSAAFLSFSVNILGRLIAIFVFLYLGFESYILVIIFLPILITILALFGLKEWLVFKGNISKEKIIINLKEAKHFTFSTYLSYLYNKLDQLLISIFFPAEFLGSFTLAKRILVISKTIIENIFDPMIQKLVYLKNDINKLESSISNILKIRNITLGLAFAGLPLIYFYVDEILNFMGLNNYLHLNSFLLLIYISLIFFTLMKVKVTIISFFYDSIFYLKIAVFQSITSLLFFLVFAFIDLKIIFAYLSFSFLTLWIYSRIVYKKNDGIKNINK